MTALTHTDSASRISHRGAYLAGTGATGALIAGAVVVFLSLAAFLAFKGFPFGGSGGDEGNVYVGANAGAPEAAAAALAAAPGAVAAAPLPGTAAGAGAGAGGAGADGAGGGPDRPGGTSGTSETGTQPTTDNPVTPTTPDPGAITGTVQNLDQAAGTDLSGTTSGLTEPLDDALNDTLNGLGGAVGNDHLGDDLSGQVDQTTGNLLPGD